jgi:amino acid transporter
MALVQVITTILKFVPLVLISTVGLFFIDWSMLQPFNRTDGSLLAAVVSILSTLVIFGTVPNDELQDPTAQPFVQSFDAMFGGS